MAQGSSLDGLAGALRAVARIPEAMKEARAETLHDWADDVENTARGRVARDTGNLAQSLEQQVHEQYGRAEVGVWDPEELEYSLYVEKGTSSMPDQPYLVPSFEEHRPEVPAAYRAALRRHLRTGAG